jgi:hypothetical protein
MLLYTLYFTSVDIIKDMFLVSEMAKEKLTAQNKNLTIDVIASILSG